VEARDAVFPEGKKAMLLPRKEAHGDSVCRRGRRMGGDAGCRREEGAAGVRVGAATPAAAGKKAERDLGWGGGL
jgi:hypothetical protein